MPREIKKGPAFICLGLLGGLERIRTAVGAFAELSLAARPRDHIYLNDLLLSKFCSRLANGNCGQVGHETLKSLLTVFTFQQA